MVILGYHEIVNSPTRSSYAVSKDLFRKQLFWVKDNGFRTISISELCDCLLSKKELPQKAAVLTFDDGLLSQFNLAYPLLKELGLGACFFVIASCLGKPGFMDWQHLKELMENGMEIGSHGLSHNLLNMMSYEEIEKEFLASKAVLENKLNKPVEFLSIPRGQENPKIRRLAVAAGYKAICISTPGYIYKNSSAESLQRVFLRNSNTLSDFEKIINGECSIIFGIKIRWLFLKALRCILGMRLYEKIRRRILKYDYSH